MIITKTPFRMSFFGGGTDVDTFYLQHGGAVLSTTFDKYCYVTLRHLPAFFDYKSEFVYSRTERVNEKSEILHPAIRAAVEWKNLSRIRLNYEADLPARTGLGTSSAFAVGLLHAVAAARGEAVDKPRLAAEAIHLERELCRECGGVQDQIAVSFGGFNRLDFETDGHFRVTRLALSPDCLKALESRLLLFFTGVSRISYKVQEETVGRMAENERALLSMKDMVDEAVSLLHKGELDGFGRLLHESWEWKRGLSPHISTPRIDRICQKAREAGALGEKLLGAGGGGFLLFYAPPEKQPALRAALKDLIEVPFHFEREGTKVLFSDGDNALI